MPGSTPSAFEFISSSDFPISVAANDSVTFFVRFSPTSENSRYLDSAEITTSGTRIRSIITGSSLVPCITMEDLDFGRFSWPADSGAVRTLLLSICNDGAAPLQFASTDSAWVFRWNDTETFTVLPNWLDSLAGRVMEDGECFRIPVTAHITRPGVFGTTAYAQTDAGCHRDSSVWSVTIQAPVDVPEWESAGFRLESPRPSPTAGRVTMPFSIGRSRRVVIDVIDMTGRIVATPFDASLAEGSHQATASLYGMGNGEYIVRIRCGDWASALLIIIVR